MVVTPKLRSTFEVRGPFFPSVVACGVLFFGGDGMGWGSVLRPIL